MQGAAAQNANQQFNLIEPGAVCENEENAGWDGFEPTIVFGLCVSNYPKFHGSLYPDIWPLSHL
jgi:hypothetical protein